MAGTLTSKRHVVADDADAVEFCHARGWTDGLPVIPPTADRVRAMLDAVQITMNGGTFDAFMISP